MIAELSGRTRDIRWQKGRLNVRYVALHGRRPSDGTMVRLRARERLGPGGETRILTGEQAVPILDPERV